MTDYPVDVAPSGAVVLGRLVVCDGFRRDYKVRVQSHVHTDHLFDFETSKGEQDIYMSGATRQLLIAEMDAELPIRENIHALEDGVPKSVAEDVTLTLLKNNHMLGSVQALVEERRGARLGYSGDFSWPMDRVMEVDALVVDSTYGSPERRREYSQADAEARLLDLVADKLRSGPVHIHAHEGTLQRSFQILSGLNYPLLASKGCCKKLEIYREFAYGIGDVASTDSPKGKEILAAGKYIRFFGKGDKKPVEIPGSTVILSAYMSRSDDPVLEYSPRSARVALSNHADFDETLEYIKATHARFVVTDNRRGGHAVELAREIRARLGIEARPSTDILSLEWGI